MPIKPGEVQPPEAEPNSGAPDLAGFMSDVKTLLGDYRKDINAVMKSVKDLKATPPPPKVEEHTEEPVTPETPPAIPKPLVADPATNAELIKLRKDMQGLVKAAADADTREKKAVSDRMESERLTTIRAALNDVPFEDEIYRNLFFKAINPDIKRDDNGDFVGESSGVTLPLKDFLNAQAEQYNRMLKPKGAGGAGATAGNRGPGGKQRWTLADFEPGRYQSLKPAEQAELHAETVAGRVIS